jgi:hypothetical protein
MRAQAAGNDSLVSVAAIAAALGFALAASRSPALWGSDSFAYAVRTQIVAGVPSDRAVATTQAFLRTLPHPERYAGVMNDLPLNDRPYWRLFSVRRVYPTIAAALWRRRGFAALPDVSLISYAAAILATFWLVLPIATRMLALLAAVGFGALAFSFANAALTDMTAVLFLIVALGALLRYLRTPNASLLVLYAIALGLLTFTRPVPYLVLFAAAASLGVAILRRLRETARAALGLTLCAIAWCVGLAVAARLQRVPDFWSVMAHLQRHWTGAVPSSHGALTAWWRSQSLAVARDWVQYHVISIWPLVAAIGFVIRVRDPRFAALSGVWCAGIVSIALNPDPYALARTVLLPSFPVLLCGAAGLAALPFERGRTSERKPRLAARPTHFL